MEEVLAQFLKVIGRRLNFIVLRVTLESISLQKSYFLSEKQEHRRDFERRMHNF